jgi:hypothetical protein
MTMPRRKRKNPYAVGLGRLGGRARAAKLSPEELSRIGKAAVAAREQKRRAKTDKTAAKPPA